MAIPRRETTTRVDRSALASASSARCLRENRSACDERVPLSPADAELFEHFGLSLR